MGNKSLLELIKQYWYLGILFVILIVVLVIGTNQEKPWSESLAITETTSSTAEEAQSAIVESEVSSTVSEDKDNVFRKETKLFFLSDHQPDIEEMEESVESEPEELEEAEDSTVEVESIEPTESSSYTPTYSNDTYSKPKSSSSSSTNSSPKPTTPKQPVKDPVPETDESESVHESNSEPVETPETDSETTEDSSSAPEIIESETSAEEIPSIDSSISEE